MNRLVIAAMIGFVSVPVWAGPGILPVKGVKHATYDMVSSTLTSRGPARCGSSVWACSEPSGYYFSTCDTVHDWGDCGDPDTPYQIGCFSIAYATQLVLPDRVTAVICFYGDDNGGCASSPTCLAGFILPNLPTGDPGTPQQWNGWIMTVELDSLGYDFTLAGDDLDGDGLVDFGYTYWFWDFTCCTGPQITYCNAPGVEDGFETFSDPNLMPGSYTGTHSLEGNEPTQIYMELFEPNWPPPCPYPGDSGNYCSADIEPGTGPGDPTYCVIDLKDLGVLLASYNLCPGDPGYIAVANLIDPNTPPDGCVGLADLGVLLAQYGDDCNVP
jgi:hypothetical protein